MYIYLYLFIFIHILFVSTVHNVSLDLFGGCSCSKGFRAAVGNRETHSAFPLTLAHQNVHHCAPSELRC